MIAVLTAALAAPPFIDWGAQRGVIERAISRAAGVEAKTDGRIEVRLLPSPRIRIERLRLGPAELTPLRSWRRLLEPRSP